MQKQNQDLTWQETDAQLLDALLLATGGEGGASLQDVLLMADAAYDTVFSLLELQQGLEKLISVNYLHIQKNKLALTTGFLEAYEAKTLQEGPDAANTALPKLLQEQELSAEKLETVRQQELKKYKLKNHYQQYLEQFG